MSLHLHKLGGCSPAPLAFYLKALGILRIISEQTDPEARGWWQDEHFCLLTKLSREELESFFLNKYSPSPIFNPWGARSGFYPGTSESTSRAALKLIEASSETRLAEFRTAIQVVRQTIEEFGGAKPDDRHRAQFLRTLRRRSRGSSMHWLSTVVADLGDEFQSPPIFGSGGNEGSGGYPSAYYAAVAECVVRRQLDAQLSASLWNQSKSPSPTWDGHFQSQKLTARKVAKKKIAGPFRQFLPEDDATAWGLILMFEGALLIQTGVTRRSDIAGGRTVSSPFYFEPHGVGSTTSCDSDEFVINKGKRLPGRGEQWFPLWSRPATIQDVGAFFLDGKCSIGRKAARKPVDAVRATGRLGTAQGIEAFVRYGYFQRNNLATHFAVPLGRVHVKENPRSHLIDDLADWMNRLQRLARESHAPARLVHGERRLADAVFSALTHDYTPDRWRLILEAAADIEAIQAAGTAIKAGPIPKLKPDWVSAIRPHDPESAREVRLALALAGAASYRPYESVRHHFLPLQNGGRYFNTSDKRLADDVRVVATGRDAVADCGAIVLRRLIDTSDSESARLPLHAAPGCGATLPDLAAMLDGHVDLSRVVHLARALMAVDWRRWKVVWKTHAPHSPREDDHPDEAWLAIRLSCLPWKLDERDIPAEHSMVRRLLGGDGSAAVAIARSRLRSAGLRVPFEAAMTDDINARRWAAALAFPISQKTARRVVEILDPSSTGVPHA